MNKKYITYIVTALMLTGAGLQAGKKAKKGGGMPKMPPQVVAVEQVQLIKQTTPKEYIGTVEATDEVDLQARISGYITGIKFKQGSLVKKGQLLFTLEDTTYKAKMLAAKAQMDQAKAELQYAEQNFNRQKLLAGKNAVSKSNYEDAKRLIDFNRARYEQRKAELLDTENQLSYTKIYAPITGRIGEVKHTAGNYVSLTSSPLAKIVSVDPIQVKFSISERTFLNAFKGINTINQNLKIKIKMANGEPYQHSGKLAFVDNIVDANTGTISVWAEFENPAMKLLPGGYVTALVSEKLPNPRPGVKLSAILTDSRGSFVYVLGKENVPRRRNVTLGDVVGNVNIITSGLEAGERVITDGTHKVIPGMPVKPFAQNVKKEVPK